MENFTPFTSLVGGLAIGASAAIVLLANGRIAGISGIVGGTLTLDRRETPWRLAFIAGLIAGGVTLRWFAPGLIEFNVERSFGAIVVAGTLVGYGTRLGNGCTSGHGICGLGRGSARSLVATAIFMTTGAVVVFMVNHMLGGRV